MRPAVATRAVFGPVTRLRLVDPRDGSSRRVASHAFDAQHGHAAIDRAAVVDVPRSWMPAIRTVLRRRSAAGGDSLSAGLAARRADPAGRRAAGHDARHQRPAHAARRADGPRHHARLRRRAADRLSEPPAAVRSGDPQARAAVRGRRRNRRADRRRRRGAAGRPIAIRCARNLRDCAAQGIESLAICLLHALRASGARAAGRARSPARSAFAEISVSQSRGAADQDRLARRHDGGRRLSESRCCGTMSSSCGEALRLAASCGS